MASTRTRSIRLAIIPLVVAAVALVVLPSSGQAAPQPTLSQVKAELADLQSKAEVAQENLNAAKVALAAGQRTLTQINARVAKSQAAVDLAKLQVGRLASAAYRSGGIDQTLELLLADNPGQFLEQASALDGVSRHQADTLRLAAVAAQRLAQDKLAAAQVVARLAALRHTAAVQYEAVQAEKRQAQALVASLTAAQQAELAKERAAARARQIAEAQASQPSSSHRASRTHHRTGGGSAHTYSGTIGQKVVAYALDQVGDSYVWGATGPNSFDCSGLTMRAYSQAGISLPHSSSSQYYDSRHVSISSLQPGDLVFYYSPIHHVAIYIGGGRIVHAANPSSGVEVSGLYSMPISGAARPY